MSRVGKYPVIVPNGVTVTVNNNVVTAKGKLGELSYTFDDGHVVAKLEDNKVVVSPLSDSKQARTLWGTTRAQINSMVKGVSEGFKKELELVGVGYKPVSKAAINWFYLWVSLMMLILRLRKKLTWLARARPKSLSLVLTNS